MFRDDNWRRSWIDEVVATTPSSFKRCHTVHRCWPEFWSSTSRAVLGRTLGIPSTGGSAMVLFGLGRLQRVMCSIQSSGISWQSGNVLAVQGRRVHLPGLCVFTFRPRWLSDDWWVYEGRSWCGQPWFAALLVNWATFLALDSTGGVGPLVDEWPFLRHAYWPAFQLANDLCGRVQPRCSEGILNLQALYTVATFKRSSY